MNLYKAKQRKKLWNKARNEMRRLVKLYADDQHIMVRHVMNSRQFKWAHKRGLPRAIVGTVQAGLNTIPTVSSDQHYVVDVTGIGDVTMSEPLRIP